MEDSRYEDLQRDVNYLNEEGFVPEGKQLHVFRNADELIEAIRNNQLPGITWTEEDEAKWQAAEAIDNAFADKDPALTFEDEVFMGPEDALHLAAERETIDWTDPSISQEEIDFQWEELFKED